MTGDKLRQLEMVKRVCGAHNYANTMLVTTHWPKRIEEQKERGCAIREADLRREFWRDMIAGGSKMWRFDDEESTAKAIVRSLSGKPDITLALQSEMLAGQALTKTMAGSYIVDARRQDESSLRSKVKELGNDPNNTDLVEEIKRLQDSIEGRKAVEPKLEDDMVTRIREEIQTISEEASQRSKRPSVANIFRWLISISSLTAEVVQTVFSAP